MGWALQAGMAGRRVVSHGRGWAGDAARAGRVGEWQVTGGSQAKRAGRRVANCRRGLGVVHRGWGGGEASGGGQPCEGSTAGSFQSS